MFRKKFGRHYFSRSLKSSFIWKACSHCDHQFKELCARFGNFMMTGALGFVFLWFGGLKLFPGLSSAEAIACDTLRMMTFGLIPDQVCLISLGLFEVAIGLALIFRLFLNFILVVVCCHMLGTFMPLIFFTDLTWKTAFVPTLEGQYILKNFIIIASAFILRASHGRTKADHLTNQ